MFELEEQIRTALHTHEERETARLEALAAKVDMMSDRHYASALAQQSALSEIKIQLVKVEAALATLTARGSRQTAALWAVVTGMGLYVLQALVGKLL